MVLEKTYSISHLAIITSGYPSPARPTYTPFVRQLGLAIARQGVRCTVIHPVAVHEGLDRDGIPYYSVEKPDSGEDIVVLRPRFLSLSARDGFTHLGKLNPGLFTLWSFTTAAKRALKRHALFPDSLYGHFLYEAGAAAVRIGRAMGISAFAGVGEGEFWTVRKYGRNRAKRDFEFAAGFVANSSLLKNMLNEELNINRDKIGIFPNGVDTNLMFPRNKQSMRKKYGFPPDLFLIACIGNYHYKKGPHRVGIAIKDLKGVGGIFMGAGPLPPEGDNIIFDQLVPIQSIPELLSAADIFVLPTLVEGSCNSIVEAMACGLPIVSSKGAFNDDLLTDDMSIRIDPLDIHEIRRAICTLRDDPFLRAKMANAALCRSHKFNVNDRARRILAFMETRVREL